MIVHQHKARRIIEKKESENIAGMDGTVIHSAAENQGMIDEKELRIEGGRPDFLLQGRDSGAEKFEDLLACVKEGS